MRMLNRIVFILFWFFTSCQTNYTDDRIPLAKVFDEYLYLDQVPSFRQLGEKDSLIFLQNFSNQWASKKILLNKAQYNLKKEQLYIDSLVDVYKKSLLIHYYKEAVIQNYLDTIISDSLVENYYINSIDNFQLKESLVKINYIKIRNVAPNLDFVSKNYFSDSADQIEALEDYCIQFAEKFFLGDVSWISWSEFLKQLPLKKKESFLNPNSILRKNRRFELEDSIYTYFIFIQDFKLKGDSSPLEYVSSIIKKILINKRKKEIIYNIEEKLIQEAIENNNFKIYE